MNKTKAVREPLFHIAKRTEVSLKREIVARAIAVVIGLLISCIVFWAVYGISPLTFIKELFTSNFANSTRIGALFRDTALLLGVGLALIPAFKMKFWNLGGNGQILVGAIVTYWVSYKFGNKLPDVAMWALMLVLSVLAGAIWAVIPAIFKALFKTNESLFTLMMNYIALGLVAVFVKEWSGVKSSGSLKPMKTGLLPQIAGNDYLLIIFAVVLVCIFMFVYMKYSKHGFEIAVVGDSENTAKYVGMNVKKVIIRTLILSGALCGFMGFLITGAMDHSFDADTAKNLGFTAIIAVWIAHNNPLATAGTSFGIIFLTNAMNNIRSLASITDDSVTNMIVGVMYFCIIACEFFIYYAIKTSKDKEEMRAEFKQFTGKIKSSVKGAAVKVKKAFTGKKKNKETEEGGND